MGLSRTSKGRFVHLSPELRHDFFDFPSPHADWLAGLLAADGCVRNDRVWSIGQSGDHGCRLVEQVASLIHCESPISVRQPQSGELVYTLTVSSSSMVTSLRTNYGVSQRKTVNLQWPGLIEDRASAFLRGYVDGDGCVGVYQVGTSPSPMLSISLVGTSLFITGARSAVPSAGRVRRIDRCADLTDLRWSGRFAWTAGQWLYQHSTSLPLTVKASRFAGYGLHLLVDPPAWASRASRRQRVEVLLASGLPPMRVAELVGEKFQTVYKWRASLTG
jgi:hypothetical protein